MSRTRKVPPTPKHVHPGSVEVRKSKTKMRRTKNMRIALTRAVTEGWTDEEIDQARRGIRPKGRL